MKFKSLALVAIMALGMSNMANAGTIFTEDQAQDLDILIVADLVQSYKVSVTNDDMDDSANPAGSVQLTPASLQPALSLAAGACKDPADATITYVDSGTTCAVVNNGNASNSHAHFAISFDYLVELAGPGSVDLNASLLGQGGSDSPFSNSLINFDAGTPAATAALSALIDQDAGVLAWSGDMEFSQGPLFEETIHIDVVKN